MVRNKNEMGFLIGWEITSNFTDRVTDIKTIFKIGFNKESDKIDDKLYEELNGKSFSIGNSDYYDWEKQDIGPELKLYFIDGYFKEYLAIEYFEIPDYGISFNEIEKLFYSDGFHNSDFHKYEEWFEKNKITVSKFGIWNF